MRNRDIPFVVWAHGASGLCALCVLMAGVKLVERYLSRVRQKMIHPNPNEPFVGPFLLQVLAIVLIMAVACLIAFTIYVLVLAASARVAKVSAKERAQVRQAIAFFHRVPVWGLWVSAIVERLLPQGGGQDEAE